MPCYTHPDEYLRMDISSLETMLCGVCRRIEACTLFVEASARPRLIADDPALVAWWAKHKAKDDLRLAAEAAHRARRKVLKNLKARLSPEERAALGIENA